MRNHYMLTVLLALFGATAAYASDPASHDPHSFANPEHIRVQHVELNLDVQFDRQVLRGEAILSVRRISSDTKQPLILDTHHLRIEMVESSTDGQVYQAAGHVLGPVDPILGQSLTIQVPEQVRTVRIRYVTSAKSGALQWLGREQTATKRQPFLFTQSQAIEARSWIPLQDSPAVRVTYAATIRTPKELRAVMSADNKPVQAPDGKYHFAMKQAIPPYLIALAVGELEYRDLGPRTGVYAEPGVVARAAAEFADMEAMLRAAEELYGPYRWGRYDVLVLPPSFPFGGMENPRLTFASPTILAGDKSLISLVAHELAHSWSGNLVSNATWRDFWLNEGFTVYVERRILEKVFGKDRADMEAVLGRASLLREMAGLPAADQILHIDLKGRSPDDALTDVAYEKGALFLKHLELTYGRERFDAFLRSYFDHFAFQSITTAQFATYLDQNLVQAKPDLRERASVAEWLYQPGLASGAPRLSADALTRVENSARDFASGQVSSERLPGKTWTTQEWLHFLTSLPEKLDVARMRELDAKFDLTHSQNAEITFTWLLLAVRHRYDPASARLEEFLTSQGRRKFLKPLYEELAKSPEGKERAARIYRQARPGYHPLAVGTVDEILGWKP